MLEKEHTLEYNFVRSTFLCFMNRAHVGEVEQYYHVCIDCFFHFLDPLSDIYQYLKKV